MGKNTGTGRQKYTFVILVLFLLLILIFSACLPAGPAEAESEELDVRGTLDALGHPNPEDNGDIAVPEPVNTAIPAPTATIYIPEGQLYAYNFDGVPEGIEYELHPGIILIKPEYGIQINLSEQTDYYLAAGLISNNDANVSIYARNLSEPEKTIAQIACRSKNGLGENGLTSLTDGYIAYLRFDGATRLVKKINNKDFILADWKKGVALNAPDLYNQLYLLCDGERLLFMVNAQVIFDVLDADLTEGDYAVGISNQIPDFTSMIQFDKFLVYEP